MGVAAFRFGSCDFVDRWFWRGKWTIHEITRTNTNKTPKGIRVLAQTLKVRAKIKPPLRGESYTFL
jgi:hypothetical protein